MTSVVVVQLIMFPIFSHRVCKRISRAYGTIIAEMHMQMLVCSVRALSVCMLSKVILRLSLPAPWELSGFKRFAWSGLLNVIYKNVVADSCGQMLLECTEAANGL